MSNHKVFIKVTDDN